MKYVIWNIIEALHKQREITFIPYNKSKSIVSIGWSVDVSYERYLQLLSFFSLSEGEKPTKPLKFESDNPEDFLMNENLNP